MHPTIGRSAPASNPTAETLTENGREEYGWRIVDAVPRLVVVRIGFTLRGHDHEPFVAFQRRMLCFAAQLTDECDYRVTSLQLHRRAAQNKTPWAEFDCQTPDYHLPACDDQPLRPEDIRDARS